MTKTLLEQVQEQGQGQGQMEIAYNVKKKKDIFCVDPRLIQFDPAENPRKDYGTPEELAELKNSIRENGVEVALKAYSFKDEAGVERYQLIRGYRRMTCVKELIEEGTPIDYVPVQMVRKPSEEDILLDHVLSNAGKALTDVEKAEIFGKLVNKFGWTRDKVAKKTGWNLDYVGRLVVLAKMPESVKQIVGEGFTTPSMVNEVNKIEKDPDKAAEIIKKGKEEAIKDGKKRLEMKHIPELQKRKEESDKKHAEKVLQKAGKATVDPEIKKNGNGNGQKANNEPPKGNGNGQKANPIVDTLDKFKDVLSENPVNIEKIEVIDTLAKYFAGKLNFNEAVNEIFNI